MASYQRVLIDLKQKRDNNANVKENHNLEQNKSGYAQVIASYGNGNDSICDCIVLSNNIPTGIKIYNVSVMGIANYGDTVKFNTNESGKLIGTLSGSGSGSSSSSTTTKLNYNMTYGT